MISRISKRHLALITVGFIQLAICILGISRSPMTPFDEPAHFDYVAKIAHGHLPKVNEKYGQVALESQACMKDRYEAWSYIEPCGSAHYTPKLAPFYGQSSATGYLPTYYAITAVPYDACDLLTPNSHLNCGRFANSLWLVGASVVMTQLGLILGGSTLIAGLVALGINSIGTVLLQGITVNSDAAVQLLAPLAILIAIRLGNQKRTLKRTLWYWLGFCAFASSIKLTIAPMILLATLVLAYLWTEQTAPRINKAKNYLKFYFASGAGVAIMYLLQMVQPTLRGVGGKDIMKDWLIAHDTSTMASSMWLTFHSTLQPFNLFTWTPNSTSLNIELANFIALLGWACVAAFSQSSMVQATSVQIPRFPKSFGGIGLAVAILLPLAMCWWSWKSYGSASVQPRYYMATLSTFLVIGTNVSKDLVFRTIVFSILSVSLFLTVFQILKV